MFTLVLFSVSAVPVFASDPPSEPIEASPVTPPGEAQVREGLKEVERREAERLQNLQTPALVEQREESRDAFADVSESQAQDLLREAFPSELASLNADPARYVSDVELLRAYGESGGTVTDEGNGMLLETEVPLRAEDADGDLTKIDVSLEPVGDGVEPANPLVELHVPDASTEPIEVGEEGLAIELVGAEEAPAQSFGEKNVWFGDVETDTDLMVSPTSAGVELFDQLRSSESPETLRFRLELPEGAEVHENGGGGADISKEGEVVAFVSPPSAVDAQGTPVPVELEVEGQQIVVHVPHREGDFAYPILLDPQISENWGTAWYFGSNNEAIDKPGIWGYNTNDPTETYILHNTYCLNSALCSPSGRGLFISTMNRNIPANTWAQWYYNVPGSTTYIPSIYPEYSAYLNPFWRNNGNCSYNSYKQPHDYDGAYDASGNWVYLEEDRAQWYGTASIFTNAKGIAFGMSSGGGVNIPCWRSIMVGGTVIYLDDPEKPTLSSVTGVPTGWVNATTPFTITASASDPGLGVQNVTMAPEGAPVRYFTALQNQCPGIKTKPCPASTSSQLVANGTLFDEGQKNVSFSVYDPTGKPSNTISKTIRVDRTPPEVTIAGQLGVATEETKGDALDPEKWDPLPLAVYSVKIEATDGSTTSGATKRSGVKSAAVYLDGSSTPVQAPWEQSCSILVTSCPMTQTLQLKVSGLAIGKHTCEVKVKDQVGNERVRKIEFEYIPATGMKDDYILQRFPLESDEGEEAGGPELAVNVMNGNLVYHERDVHVEGSSSVDLDVERFYNSQLPDSANTEWGDGWTLAETPELDPEDTGGAPAADQAELVDSTGTIEAGVGLPESADAEAFDEQLQGALTKTANGYELRDETGETATTVAFDENGRTEELQAGDYVGVDYDYEGGDLSEIAVDDPGSAGGGSEVKYSNPAPYNPRYSSAFGSLGSGSGQMNAPGDVVRDPSGNLWVVDTANNRVEKFNAKGEFLMKVGSYGSGDGQFKRPTAIALSTNSWIVVADSGNSRIQKFTPTGEFSAKFGTKGTGDGQFGGAGPEGIVMDSLNNIWVSDTANGRIEKFGPTGTFLEIVGSKGSAPGQLAEPTGIDIGLEGNLWVADAQNNRVSVFSASADGNAEKFIRQLGTAGGEEGQFNRPDTVEVDDQGNVWVGDQGNNRIERFDLNGEYRGEFGAGGSGQAQFSFTSPMGIASSPSGELWITDGKNNRVQKWRIPGEVPLYSSSFGSAGTADGQMQAPGDVAIDPQGNFWVVDTANNRIEKFNAKGEFLMKVGSYGSGDGQFKRPTAIALTKPNSYILVADSGNNRIQKFTPSGDYYSKFGTKGTGNGQFGGTGPEGIAFGPESNIWVADTYNGRIEKFDAGGNFLGVVGSKGSGSGQFSEPTGIDFGPGGVWVADSQNNRISVFSVGDEGQTQFLRQFGSAGSAEGQFNRPDAIDVDAEGNVWVGDQNNGRVQRFNLNGEYLAQFGAKGSGEGQFSFANPFGIATDDAGGIWVTDPNNNRVQEWLISSRIRIEDDPSVEVSTSEGLVETVEGEEAGEHSYEHEGDELLSHDGPQGETEYSYDSAGRLAGIVLPDGTSALIAYNGGYGRVSSVTVDLTGETPAKTTYFEYSDEPRRTVVISPDAPHVTYDIGEDGSVLKWWNTPQPPSINDLSGSLYFDREKSETISIGDHNLVAQAHSEEGVASIQVIANGDTLVDEATCDQDSEKAGLECLTVVNEWVTETGALTPGILNLEVIVTDRLGGIESKRFWVNIPYTPPEPPGAIAPPKFKDIKRFREEFGLEVVFPVANELELNDRIFDLIGAWHNPQTPAGEVARASWERWGVPLRAVDVAELEYRDRYVEIDSDLIENWAATHYPGTYSGNYVDHRGGGTFYIGFTQDQSSRLSEVKAGLPLMALDRLATYPAVPSASRLSLVSAYELIDDALESNATLRNIITKFSLSELGNELEVETTDIPQAQAIITDLVGPQIPVKIYHGNIRVLGSSRHRADGRMRAGDRLLNTVKECTAAFGTFEERSQKSNGENITARFVLAAGHCFSLNGYVYRSDRADFQEAENWTPVGQVTRNAFHGGQATDGLAIRTKSPGLAPHGIFGSNGNLILTGPAATAKVGTTLCYSGVALDGVSCGEVTRLSMVWEGSLRFGEYNVKFNRRVDHGDSGAPVWNPRTGNAVGIVSGFYEGTNVSTVAPLLHPPGLNLNRVPGILHHPDMLDMHLIAGG